ncbi:MAG: hypothetical protein IH617_15255 [Hydrogenophaga sp.]|nr:hypothetical protein [Hydrogenophaga sp.]
MSDELEMLDAVATAQWVRRGELSAREVIKAAFDRLHARNPAINAVIDSWEREALARASAGVPMGLLAGVPLLLKDTMDYPGRRFSMGSRLRLDATSQDTDPWLAAMLAEGAIVIGKTNTPEFGLLDVTEPIAFGPTFNPWQHDVSSGGSSGGSAAAVAARITPIAHGSDGGGSIRYPAACCGVFGLKPTRGRTASARPAFDDRLQGMVSTHALTRSVRDSALAFAIAESAHRGPVGKAVERWVKKPLDRAVKVALVKRPLHGGALAAAHETAVERTADLLRGLGHEVVPCDWPFDAPMLHAAFFDRWAYGVHVEATGLPEDERRRFINGTEPWTQGLQREGAALTSDRVEAMVQRCLQASVQMERFHREWDVLMTPVSAEHSIPLGDHAPSVDYATLRERVSRNVAFTPVQNITGQPGMSVPLYWSDAGLPVGVHFAAGTFRDELLLQLAYQLEAAQPWGNHAPTILEKTGA